MSTTLTLYGLLNQDAKNWWYWREMRERGQHAEARAKERESIRRHIRDLRACRTKGYFSVGRGGWSLHYANTTVSHYGDVTAPIIQAAIRLGIPGVDTTTIPDDTIMQSINSPMIGLDRVDGPPYTSFSFAPMEYVFRFKRDMGATIYNCKLEG